MPSINTILHTVKAATDSLEHSEKQFAEHYGSGTLIQVSSDEKEDGYIALVISIPGHGYALTNVHGEVNTFLTCPKCNQNGQLPEDHSNKEDCDGNCDICDEDHCTDDETSDMQEEMGNTPMTFNTLLELYSSLPKIEVLGTLSSVTENLKTSVTL